MTKEWVKNKRKEYMETIDRLEAPILEFIKVCPVFTFGESDRKHILHEFYEYKKHPLDGDSILSFYINLFVTNAKIMGKENDEIKKWEEKYNSLHYKKWTHAVFMSQFINQYLDSEPVEFDGDIIITDPCYLVKERTQKEDEEYEKNKPKEEDFHTCKEEDFTDADSVTIKDSKKYQKETSEYLKALGKYQQEHMDDWKKCNYGMNFEALGIQKFMSRDTIYGDWSCTVFDIDTEKPIGTFCADAGMVSVVDLSEAVSYNPEILKWLKEYDYAATVIKDFKGTVQFIVERIEIKHDTDTGLYKAGDISEDYSVVIEGHGINKTTGRPVNFIGKQTGF